MKTGICKDTCAPGVNFFEAGREYMVDETDTFIKRHFEFPAEVQAEEIVNEAEPEAPAKKGRKKQ